jgi:hypothetical protein
MGLLIVQAFKFLGVQSMNKISDKPVFIPFPQIFGLNMKSLAAMGNFLDISTCNQWYMYEFAENVNKSDR